MMLSLHPPLAYLPSCLLLILCCRNSCLPPGVPLPQLNITASSSYIKQKLREVDFNGDGVLQFNEFVFLMRALGERPEVTRRLSSKS